MLRRAHGCSCFYLYFEPCWQIVLVFFSITHGSNDAAVAFANPEVCPMPARIFKECIELSGNKTVCYTSNSAASTLAKGVDSLRHVN